MKAIPLFCVLLLSAAFTAHGEDVTIYRPQGETTPTPAPAAPSPSSPAIQAPIPKAIAVNPPVAPAPASTGSGQTYTVQKGDSLWKISKTYGVSMTALKDCNHLTTDDIKVGSVLKIPAAGAQEEVRKAEPVSTPPPVAIPVAKPVSQADAPVAVPPAPSAPSVHFPYTVAQVELQKKFVAETKELALAGIGYNRDWRPPGQDEEWAMDCSNTTRYLYKKVLGIGIERTASDQYYYLEQKNMAWNAPLNAQGEPDPEALSAKLEIGDLLFWENTYKPQRDPPITHVMIYLGQNKKGQWLMAGSQMGGGFFNVSGSGPDIYVFRPQAKVGGFSTNFGFTHVSGHFVAYGRPLLQKPHGGTGPVQLANAN